MREHPLKRPISKIIGTVKISNASDANFYHSKFQASASNPRKLFATFSSLLNPPPPPPPSSLSADDFVNHFEKKVDDIRSSFAKSNDTAGSAHTALPCTLTSFSPLSPDEISRLVTAGRPTTCPLDPIPSSLLQTISGDLLPYLTSLINSSLTAGYVPSVFKRARVAPLLKKPTLDPSDVNNYRPVSLLSFLSKTLERAVLGQLSCYLSQNDLLDPNQSGFKTSHSTETALLCVTEALRTAKANSLSSALILLDLSAAFDTVNHQILLSTLSELGISGAAHAWIASYLTGRSYQVVNRISACLADISVWMTDHHLKLNLGKTELLFLPGKDCPFHDLAITVDNSIVSSSQSAKNLGVILDNTLSFSTNIKAAGRFKTNACGLQLVWSSMLADRAWLEVGAESRVLHSLLGLQYTQARQLSRGQLSSVAGDRWQDRLMTIQTPQSNKQFMKLS
ncbi:uncharacterized protein ACWYII_008888 [Salvelinus alpinus]